MTTINKVRNPRSGECDYEFSEPTSDQITAAAQRLRKHQPAWAAKSVTERINALREFSECWRQHDAELLEAIMTDTGRSQVARIEVDSLPAAIERVAADIETALANTEPRPASIPVITGWQHRVPYGLIGNITPWNFPIILSFMDTLPALAAGNAVLVKPRRGDAALGRTGPTGDQ